MSPILINTMRMSLDLVLAFVLGVNNSIFHYFSKYPIQLFVDSLMMNLSYFRPSILNLLREVSFFSSVDLFSFIEDFFN